jgi:hypothetical protein
MRGASGSPSISSYRSRALVYCMAVLATSGGAACRSHSSTLDARVTTLTELLHLPTDRLDRLIEASGVEVDRKVSSDGRGSLRIKATGTAQTIRLFEITGLRLEKERVVFRTQVRAEGTGRLYTKIVVDRALVQTFYGRSKSQPLESAPKWRTVEARRSFRSGEAPDRLELQLIIEDKSVGTVWIDDARLLSGPLPLVERR